MLTLGVVPYLNALPLWWTLRDESDVTIVRALPSQLGARLEAGEFDAALLPVADHLRGCGAGLLGDSIVGATGAVRSVLLFSRVPTAEIQSVALDTSSHSSAALVRVILRDFYRLEPIFVDHPPRLNAMLERADAALLIGDPALEARRSGVPFLDLAEEWSRFTGLSFVFAAWTAGKNLDNAGALVSRLNAARDQGVQCIESIAAQVDSVLSRAEIEDYLHHAIEYRLSNSHRAGLAEFARRLADADSRSARDSDLHAPRF